MKLTELVMLARVMSQRYGVDVCIAEDGKASCHLYAANGQRKFVITLPYLKDKGKFDKMIRGYLDHEIGHVLYTDFALDEELAITQPRYYDSYFRIIHNILEDVYVEEHMGAMYPGSKGNLRWLARHVFTQETAVDGVAKIMADWKAGAIGTRNTIYHFVVPYCLFKRRGMADPELRHSHALFDSVRNALAKIDPSVAEALDKIDDALIQPANSSKETAELARIIWYALDDMKLVLPDLQQDQAGDQHGEGDEEQQDQAGDQQGQSGNGGSFQKRVNTAAQEMHDAVANAAGKNGASGQRKPVTLQTGVSDALNAMIASGRDGAECEAFADTDCVNIGSAFCEQEKLSRLECLAYGKSLGPDARDKVSILRSGFMRTIPGLLQSVQFTPCRVGYAGRISGRDLYKTGIGNGRIFQKKAERREQRIDAAILLDASGSMRDDILDAQITLYAMLGMLKSLPKVRSYAALFSSDKYMVLSRFTDTRINNYYASGAMGCTPTAGAVLKVLREFSTGSDVRRILFVITDGNPDSPPAFEQSLKVAYSQGVEVYGITLGNNLSAMNMQFGEDNVVTAMDIKELPVKLAAVMKTALLKAVA